MPTLYDAAGGDEGLLRLAHAWHERVLADEVVALGGPARYSERYGDETAVVRMHSGNGEHDEMNRRAIPRWSWDGLEA